MWGTRLRIPFSRSIQTPGRVFASSFTRGRPSPRNPRNSIRKPEPIVPGRREPAPSKQPESSTSESNTLNPHYDPAQNTLLSPVHIPEDPNGVLKETHPATGILANSGLVVQRQLELMNVMIGFEQANKYVIMDANGNHIGYMAEQEKGITNMMARQWFRTHRSFVTHVFDRHENEVLRFHRPFSWINSRIRVYDPLDLAKTAYPSSTALQSISPGSLIQATGGSNARVSPLGLEDMRVVGEAQQQWAPLRRKYNLFTYHHSPNNATEMGTQTLPLSHTGLSNTQQMQLARTTEGSSDLGEFHQFAYVDEPFLSWDFSLRSADSRLIGSVNRNFVGFAREIFTDTGVYALRMDSAAADSEQPSTQANAVAGMTLDQRAVMLASAVSIDFDYFSRHSGAGGMGFMPIWIPGVGGEAAAGGAAAGEAGAIGEAAAGTIGRAGAAGGIAEGAAAGVAGAGAMAGYDALSRGMGGEANAQYPPGPEQQQTPVDQQSSASAPGQPGPYGDVWADEQENPWSREPEDPWGADEAADDGETGGDDYDWF
ncbi:scramblase family protein [Aspergillus clavatus NRRL 1]|uniref:Scramblase family protein n=1 Tax=Aspergillus clavatus (strain ATCC 1007 / CBS 513.65 / DSM 816 / NCTC 3887 / NRRL 1 / QM 1276 / 107) TaxID=344612 RepID=A1C4T3_ASPCL|nr:scramblase family protein [Aspergillus clavatus NRRL 1]EAW14701.1 scramblase family protein [Aspergillus clavatus NRRL 1]